MTRDELYRAEMQRLREELDLTKRQLDTVLRLLGKEIEKRNQVKREDPCYSENSTLWMS